MDEDIKNVLQIIGCIAIGIVVFTLVIVFSIKLIAAMLPESDLTDIQKMEKDMVRSCKYHDNSYGDCILQVKEFLKDK